MELLNERADIVNYKLFVFDNSDKSNRLITYSEIEKYNQEDRYSMNINLDYSEADKVVLKRMVTGADRAISNESAAATDESPTTYLPNDDIKVSVGISEIAALKLRGSQEIAGDVWFSYNTGSSIDTYNYVGDETIECLDEEQSCKKIVQHSSMFDVTYWLNEENEIMKMEQNIGADYTVIFEVDKIEEYEKTEDAPHFRFD